MQVVQREVNQQLASTPGGTQVAPNVVSYDLGSVRVVFPLPGSGNHAQDPGPTSPLLAAAAQTDGVTPDSLFSEHGCPYGSGQRWSCFYRNKGFGGTMLEFEDCGYEQYFSNYKFNNSTSSWVNTKDYATVTVRTASGTLLWTEGTNSEDSWVGAANNDRAGEFYIHANGNCQSGSE